MDDQSNLDAFLTRHAGVAGTVHRAVGDDLEMAAATNIPPTLLDIVRHVPHGKGMAGAAQLAKSPVQTCNLQTDDDGPFNPAARQSGGAAAVALPVLHDDAVVAVVGITFPHEGEIDAATMQALEADVAQTFA